MPLGQGECTVWLLEGICMTRPQLSFYVDAVMKAEMVVTSVAEDNEKMVFVKTSDGLTRVVFSSKMDENLNADAVSITHTLGGTSDRNHEEQPPEQAIIPIATPLASLHHLRGHPKIDSSVCLRSHAAFCARREGDNDLDVESHCS